MFELLQLFTIIKCLEVSCSHIVIIVFKSVLSAYTTSIKAEHYVHNQIIWNNKCLVFMYRRTTFTEENHLQSLRLNI